MNIKGFIFSAVKNADLALLLCTPISVWLLKSVALSHLKEMHLWHFSWPESQCWNRARKCPSQSWVTGGRLLGVGVGAGRRLRGEEHLCCCYYILCFWLLGKFLVFYYYSYSTENTLILIFNFSLNIQCLIYLEKATPANVKSFWVFQI